ncbi:MAG: ParB/RepB/Spo0J family partition protein [Cellulomonas sp.]|uniref:ParB/RepB/Spo0J family partition protein n=1 Tax=Cellulomonas sp. TaxID=40001 RepID=UPI00258AAE26|nr:ParB/RepB/Spo0J family partition protein [Cellulomonas sp.]MCR6705118.1 ParB/RepB/Spo0J family partition protein [Cellulomonas sp.]
MSEKRRGLGRGLGALIPAGLDGQRPPAGGDRPVDVFFPDRSDATSTSGEATAAESNGVANAQVAAAAAASTAVAESTGSATTGTTTGVPAAASNGGVALADGAAVVTAGVADPADFSAIATDGLVPVPGARFAELPVGSIRPNPRQPRSVFDEDALDELVNSIREIGVLQPVVVRAVDDGYELIMGERRWRATQAAGLDVIPAIVRETDDADLLRDALLENLHRSQLNPLEEAAAYQQLLDDFGCTHEELATRIHRSRPQISNTLRLLKLPPLVQRRVAAGVLSAGHARALLGLADGAAIERLAQRIVAEGLSVRAVEEIVSLGGDDAAPGKRRQAPRAGQRNEALDELSSRLSDRFDTRVKVQLGKSRGRLTVEFASVQDLNRILATFAPDDPGLLKG